MGLFPSSPVLKKELVKEENETRQALPLPSRNSCRFASTLPVSTRGLLRAWSAFAAGWLPRPLLPSLSLLWTQNSCAETRAPGELEPPTDLVISQPQETG